jgi:hypothetical protein
VRGIRCAAALVAGCRAAGRAIPATLPPPPRGTGPELAAGAVLRQLFTLQRTCQAVNDEFAAAPEQLKTVGWEDPAPGGCYPWIVHHGARMFVAVLPARRPLVVASIDGSGRLHGGPYCGRAW